MTEPVNVRFHGGPLDGESIPSREELVSGRVITNDSRGRYELSRFRGYWSAEWAPAGQPTVAEVAGDVLPAEHLKGENVEVTIERAPAEQLEGRVGQGPEPEWRRVFRTTGSMPDPCPDRGLLHAWGPWGASTLAASMSNETRQCATCGAGEFRITRVTVEGDPLEVSAGLAMNDEPPADEVEQP